MVTISPIIPESLDRLPSRTKYSIITIIIVTTEIWRANAKATGEFYLQNIQLYICIGLF
jgi:hypothetical protein